MGRLELFLLAVGLSMDAMAAAICRGLTVPKGKRTPRHALITGAWFGGFQALMPIIGYYLGYSFSDVVHSIDHWIAFALLLLIGGNMIREAIWGDQKSHNGDFGVRNMLLMAVATSIDAMAVGISMAFLGINIWRAAAIIGIITLLLSATGIYLGRSVGSKLGDKAGIIGGIVLIAIGTKILIEHLSA